MRHTACELNSLLGQWSYVPPEAFDGGSWTAQHSCVYTFSRRNKTSIGFTSPPGCLDDLWREAVVTSWSPEGVLFEYRLTDGTVASQPGWPAHRCSLIDMGKGGMYIRAAHPQRAHPMDFAAHEWLRAATAWVVRAALLTFPGGMQLLTPGIPVSPGAPPHYDGIYMRDGFYGISHTWGLVNESRQQSYVASAEWLFSQPRSDGILPASCHVDGRCYYGTGPFAPGYGCNGTQGAEGWRGCQDLDTSSFAVMLAAHLYWHAFESTSQRDAWYAKWAPTLIGALDATTKSPDGSGLLWSNTSRPQVGFGFQDTQVKSGNVLYSSLLYWNATRLLARMANASGDAATAADMMARAEKVRASASAQLWSGGRGVFMASAGGYEADNVDVWANAFAGASGFATAEESASIAAFLIGQESSLFFEGQLRQVPFPNQWADTSSGRYVDPRSTVRTYQNGGYWATPLHHALPFIAQQDRDVACRLLNATVASFRGHGIWEWVGPFFPSPIGGAPGYTASAANVFFASEHLRCWDRNAEDLASGL
jgi:hypothetical protein